MPPSRLEYLLTRYINRNCNPPEEEELMTLIGQKENEAELKMLIDEAIKTTGDELKMPGYAAEAVLRNVLNIHKEHPISLSNRKSGFIPRMRLIAAVVIFLFAGASYWYLQKRNNQKTDNKENLVIAAQPVKVLPGEKRALLKMADGRTIPLDSLANGTITQQGSTHISAYNGLLRYDVIASSDGGSPPVYHVLSTPNGGQYQLVLPDGSKVWLNAASTLRFPVMFTGSHRDVELTGEAYFEVVKNIKRPFRVTVGQMRVNVLGTHFNVDAYTEESDIKTSLIEGSVNVTSNKLTRVLKPGQQAVLDKKEEQVSVTTADIEEVMAWKNGFFQFEGAEIATIMRQLGRWYDLEIVYEGRIPVRRFEGKISRREQLSDVLQILELSDIRFSVDGKRIIVH